MRNQFERISETVTKFLNDQNHPLRTEIQLLREIILESNSELIENIKWNGPNYCHNDADRITMKINPPKQIQLIFHRGAKKQEQPNEKIINDRSGLLIWKANDRAIAAFKDMADIETHKNELATVISDWINATK